MVAIATAKNSHIYYRYELSLNMLAISLIIFRLWIHILWTVGLSQQPITQILGRSANSDGLLF